MTVLLAAINLIKEYWSHSGHHECRSESYCTVYEDVTRLETAVREELDRLHAEVVIEDADRSMG